MHIARLASSFWCKQMQKPELGFDGAGHKHHTSSATPTTKGSFTGGRNTKRFSTSTCNFKKKMNINKNVRNLGKKSLPPLKKKLKYKRKQLNNGCVQCPAKNLRCLSEMISNAKSGNNIGICKPRAALPKQWPFKDALDVKKNQNQRDQTTPNSQVECCKRPDVVADFLQT